MLSAKKSNDDINNYITVRLNKSLLAAKNNLRKFEQLDLAGSNAQTTLQKLSITTKTDLLTTPHKYYPSSNDYDLNIIKGKTSGTTGTPLSIDRSFNSVLWESAFVKQHWESILGTRYKRATLRGDDIANGEFWVENIFDNQLVLSSRYINTDNYEKIVAKLVSYAPNMLQAYPSTAFFLAGLLEERGEALNIPFVFTSSEILYPYQRELIEKNIGRVIDMYGMAERVAMACECIEGSLHINPYYSYVEILDENNQPTDDEGYIVGTTLNNNLMPLIRYKLSDRTKWINTPCNCGSSYPVIAPISGKFEDQIYDADSIPISPSLITFAFKGVENIELSQVAQVSKDTWEVRVVPKGDFSNKEADLIKNNLLNIVSKKTRIEVVAVTSIKKTKAGKFRWVVSEYSSGR
jgi:phenylacetate-CoA ligase